MDRELLRTVRQAARNQANLLYVVLVTLLLVVGLSHHAPALALGCWAAALAAYTYATSRPQPVYLVDLAGYKAPAEQEASRAKTMVHFWRCGRFSEQSMAFQKRMLERSGLGEATHFPMSLIRLPVDMCDRTAMEESHAVIFGVVDEVLRKAGLDAGQVGVLIFNSSLLSPTPSFTSLIVKRYKFRHDVVTHNLSGMGCSAGIIAIDLAKRLLQVHRNTYALVVSTENITLNAYMGNNRPMLVTNTLFRVGGAAILYGGALTSLVERYRLFRVVVFASGEIHVVQADTDAVTPAGRRLHSFLKGVVYPFPYSHPCPGRNGEILGPVRATTSLLLHSFLKVFLGIR